MFENLLTNNLNVNFFEKSNCYAFEIPNFLSDDQYNALYKNFPNIKKNEAQNFNEVFHDKDNQHQLKAFVTEVHPDKYNKLIIENPILNEFTQTFKNPKLSDLFINKFFFKILKSRIFDSKNFLKLLIRKNRSISKKSDSLVDKFLYNDILTTVGLTYMYNGAQSFPHTDGMKKIMSLLLYFPDENVSDETNKNLGATFYDSNEFNLTGFGKNNVATFKDSENFKKKNKASMTFPFKKKNLYGFIKSHKSWHSIEPFNVNDNFIRKNININLLLV